MGFGSSTKTVGGGKAKPTADAFNKFLLGALQSGEFKEGIMGTLSGGDNPLTAPSPVDMNNPIFAAAQSLANQNNTRNIADLRSRFGAGGGAPRGSAALSAEALYRSDAGSRNILDMASIADNIRAGNRADRAITSQEKMFQQGQQMNILAQLFNSLNQANQLGTPGAQTVEKPSGFGQFMGAVGTLAPYIAAPFTGGASLGLAGLGGMSGGGGSAPMNMGGYRTPQITMGNLPPLSYPG